MTNTNDVPEAGQTSSEPVTSSSSAGNSTGDAVSIPAVVNLRIRSPSTEVGGDLNFELLPATTTVGELKERIRNLLESSPRDEQQRLIHMGKYLRGEQTLMEIFGEEALKSPEQRTLHLVLRNLQDATPESSGERVDGHTGPHVSSTQLPQFQSYPRPYDPNMLPPGGSFAPLRRPNFPGPGILAALNQQQFQITPQEMQSRLMNEMQNRLMLQRLQQEHQELTEQLNGYIHPDAATRTAENFANARLLYGNAPAPQPPNVGHNNPGIAPNGAQHTPNIPGGQQYALPGGQNLLAQQPQQQQPAGADQAIHQGPPSRAHTPDHTATFTRQGVNSNGERWQITVNESTTVIPPGNNQPQPPPAIGNDVQANLQHLLHSAERLAAMATRLNNLTRGGPGGLPTPPGMPHGMPPGLPAGNAPQRPRSTPPIGSLRPTAPSTNSFPTPTTIPSMGPLPASLPNDSPTVYIMNSPSGPQALLLHNSQTFYSGNLNIAQNLNNYQVPGFTGEVRNRRERTHRHRHRHRDANAQPADGVGAAPQPHAGQAQFVRPRAQPALWPHIWLIIRLAIFIWYFTAGGTSSWSRIFIIWGMSLFLFVLNTGAFNNILGTFWNPIRQHLENLLPLAGHNHPEVAPAPANGENAAGATTVPNPEPNPEEVARRLLQQRRQQDVSWAMTQFRRIEHAVLLFIASIVPGTAERHIEARTIEENRILELRRQEAAIAAAAVEAAAAEADLERLVDGNREGEAATVPDSVQSEAVSGNEQGDGPVPRVEQEQAPVPTEA